jgi:DNA-binding NtrC family response regulator
MRSDFKRDCFESGDQGISIRPATGTATMTFEGSLRKPFWMPGVRIKTVERIMILEALEYFNGNRTHAAKALGISVRTLRNRLKLYRTQEEKV